MKQSFTVFAFTPRPLCARKDLVRKMGERLREHLDRVGVVVPPIGLIICSSEPWISGAISEFIGGFGVKLAGDRIVSNKIFETLAPEEILIYGPQIVDSFIKHIALAQKVQTERILFFPGKGVLNYLLQILPLEENGWWKRYVKFQYGNERWIQEQIKQIDFEELVGIEVSFDDFIQQAVIVSLTFFKGIRFFQDL